MSIRALVMTLVVTVVAGLVYFVRSPFAGSAGVFLDAAATTLQIIVASSIAASPPQGPDGTKYSASSRPVA